MSVTDAIDTGLEYETGMPQRNTVLVTRNIDPVWIREKASVLAVESEKYPYPVPKIECTLSLRNEISDSEVLAILNTIHEMQAKRQSINPTNILVMNYIQTFESESGLGQSSFVDTPIE